MIGWYLVLAIAAVVDTTAAARIDAERAIERARYAFVIGATAPFDDEYPRAVFETRVQRELAEERLLADAFALRLSPATLADEYDRIETSTKAPEQWQAIKLALGGDRRRIEEMFCRPVLVSRTLRARFAFDAGIHAARHDEARSARARFLRGVADSRLDPLSIPRHADASEVSVVLERQLVRPGDVSTILEHADRFEVYRLVAITADAWTVQMVRVPKVTFDDWFAANTATPGRRH